MITAIPVTKVLSFYVDFLCDGSAAAIKRSNRAEMSVALVP